jgi:hypothetical protein
MMPAPAARVTIFVSAKVMVMVLVARDPYRFGRIAIGVREPKPRLMSIFCTGIKPGLAARPHPSVRAVMGNR